MLLPALARRRLLSLQLQVTFASAASSSSLHSKLLESSCRGLSRRFQTSGLQVGMNSLECYETDFEVALLEASGEYYKRKAAAWIQARPLLCASALHASWPPAVRLFAGRYK